jgi:hypothetical protein
MLGRGKFENWGGDGRAAYDPLSFTGFIDWAMIVFGVAFCFIMFAGLKKHDALENA